MIPGSRRARLLMALVLAGTMALAAPASGEDLHGKQAQTKSKRQQLQAQIDLARASDDKVESELARLSKAVKEQQARVGDAEQAAAAGQAELDRAAARLNDVERRTAATRQALARYAVDAYIHGGSKSPLGLVVSAKSIGEAAERRALLTAVQARTSDLLDAMRATREDLATAHKNLERVQKAASDRARVQAQAHADLVQAERGQQSTHQELQKRIDDLQQETRVLAAQEGQLQALIRSQEAARATQATSNQSATGANGNKGAPGTGTDAKGPPKSGNSGGGGSGGGSGGGGSAKPSKSGFIWPIHGPVTSEFGPRWGGFHPGIDIAAAYGTPIKAAKAGTVILASWYGGYGNFVLIDHGGGIVTGYGHQSRMAVSDGQQVSQGQVIGYEGSTGFSTGPHVHFEVRVDGTPQNPRNFESGSP